MRIKHNGDIIEVKRLSFRDDEKAEAIFVDYNFNVDDDEDEVIELPYYLFGSEWDSEVLCERKRNRFIRLANKKLLDSGYFDFDTGEGWYSIDKRV